jgi:hypothetical protein
MDRNVLERISEKTISESDLRSAIKKLEGVTEPSSLWLGIANDQTYSAVHRAIAICQFFKRHFRKPVTIVHLAGLLDGGDWIKSSTVTTVNHLKGEIPVEWNPGETVFAIRLFPGRTEASPVLYIRLSQTLEAATFVQIMASRCDATGDGASVLEAACGGTER